MSNNMFLKKSLVASIIVLFIGVGVQPVFATEIKSSIIKNEIEEVRKNIPLNIPPNRPEIDGPTNVKPRSTQTYNIKFTDDDGDDMEAVIIMTIFHFDNDLRLESYRGIVENGTVVPFEFQFPIQGNYRLFAAAKDGEGIGSTGVLEIKCETKNRDLFPQSIYRTNSAWFLKQFPILQKIFISLTI